MKNLHAIGYKMQAAVFPPLLLSKRCKLRRRSFVVTLREKGRGQEPAASGMEIFEQMQTSTSTFPPSSQLDQFLLLRSALRIPLPPFSPPSPSHVAQKHPGGGEKNVWAFGVAVRPVGLGLERRGIAERDRDGGGGAQRRGGWGEGDGPGGTSGIRRQNALNYLIAAFERFSLSAFG